jgi:hypothetical protein
MRTIKSISPEANKLREKFQKLIVNKYINDNGSLKGFKGQLYILLPKYNKKLAIYRDVNYDTYYELYSYLYLNQSQRRFSAYNFTNDLMNIREFETRNFHICFSRVWHNGTTSYSGKHWAAQAAVLYDGIEKYGFRYYADDYNFGSHLYAKIKNADALLKSIYAKILEREIAKLNLTISHE